MKQILLLILVGMMLNTPGNSQCNSYYVLDQGSEWEYQTHNAKGKLMSKNVQKVTSFSNTSAGYEATVTSMMFDEKGKELTKGDLAFSCENGTMYIDMRNFISDEQLKAFSNYEMKFESENLEIPSSLNAGQSLGDGMLTVTASGTPFPMKMTVNITDRKVEGKESVTTPAGTFECFKISSNMTMENQMGVKMTTQLSSVEWISPKVGTVRSESYNKNGKLTGYTVLSRRKN